MQTKTTFELFGVECGEGWKGLYEPLMDLCRLHDVQIFQIKEKFGGLRFYVQGPNAHKLDLIIWAVEAQSYHTCEECGEYGIKYHEENGPVYKATTGGKGWLKTLCDPCREKRDAK